MRLRVDGRADTADFNLPSGYCCVAVCPYVVLLWMLPPDSEAPAAAAIASLTATATTIAPSSSSGEVDDYGVVVCAIVASVGVDARRRL